MWVLFYRFGTFTLDYYDWKQVHRGYLGVLEESIENGEIPLFTLETSKIQFTHHFLANPEIMLSPQVVLLPLLTVERFVLLNTLFLYSLGFLGLFFLYRKAKLSPISFMFFFLLFNFNGHIVAHLSIGHIPWNAYFLLPFFMLWVLDISENKTVMRRAVQVALLIFVMSLQGGIQIVVWCFFFLLLLLPSLWKQKNAIFLTLALSLLLMSYRIIATTIVFWGYTRRYVPGYFNTETFLKALLTVQTHDYRPAEEDAYLNYWWEFTIYIGIIGFLLLAYFGLYLRLAKQPKLPQSLQFSAFDLPLIALFIFSIADLYQVIRALPIPLLSSQRVPSRFVMMVLLFLFFFACVRLQQLVFEKTTRHTVRVVALIALFLLFADLSSNMRVWNVETLSSTYRESREIHTIERRAMPAFSELNNLEQAYLISLGLGTAVSVLCLLGALWWLWKTRKMTWSG